MTDHLIHSTATLHGDSLERQPTFTRGDIIITAATLLCGTILLLAGVGGGALYLAGAA